VPTATPNSPLNETRMPPASESTPIVLERLTKLAATGLVSMFDTKKQLFCYALTKSGDGVVQQGISERYTIMCLLGLNRLEQSGGSSPIAMGPVLDKLLTDFAWIDNVGDLGLVLWLCAIMAPDRIDSVANKLNLPTALSRFADSNKNITVHLGWFVTGLSYAKLASPRGFASYDSLALEAYRRLTTNQGSRGIFGFHAVGGTGGLNRGRIGCFADQVYPIYALSRYSQAYGDKSAAAQATECGRRICEAQGPLGQWWWHYDFSSGNVIGRFPVFSVHQHAMAPMALQVLGDATGSDYSRWLFKGVEWIHNNELNFNMEDDSVNVVWRCISLSKSARGIRVAKSLLLNREDPQTNEGLSVLYECRPYELGWMLYAFADPKRRSA
jgi:hypothetical protein